MREESKQDEGCTSKYDVSLRGGEREKESISMEKMTTTAGKRKPGNGKGIK